MPDLPGRAAEMRQLVITAAARDVHALANAGTTDLPLPDRSVKDLFEAQVLRAPRAVALIHRNRRISYEQLNATANVVAWQLTRLGVRRGDVIGVCVERSPDLVAVLLAVIKCGAVYLPFAEDWPRERLRVVFGVNGCSKIISDHPERLAPDTPGPDVLAVADLTRGTGEPDPPGGPGPGDLAYVNFTSGSTGGPKGVPATHRGVTRLVTNAKYARLDEHTVTAQTAPVSFDAATFEIWGPLLNGGTCVLYHGSFLTLSGLRRLIRDNGVNTVFLTTALFNAVVDENPSILSTVDTVLTGGEAHSLPHVRRALDAYGPDKLVSVYGPTECTTFATYHPITEVRPEDPALPIGTPIQHTGIHVVRGDELCAPGELGELCLSGPGLSPGYLGDAEATRARFADYDLDGEVVRLYRTGDLVHLRPDGVLVFRGRDDEQVKINGHRVELGEVRQAVSAVAGVEKVHVAVHTTSAGERLVAAFVVGASCTPDGVRTELRRTLPRYMIPAIVEVLDELPLTAHGKVDAKALTSRLSRVGAGHRA